MPRDLISEKCLDTARAMRLPATVIYLASLSAENLTYTAPFERWLAVYQSLSRGVETDALGLLPSRDPLRVVTQHLLPGNSVAAVELRRCKGSVAIWLQALELAFDHSRFDLVLLILGQLVKKKLEIQDWLLIATSMANRQDTIKKGQADVSLGQAYLKIRQQLRGPQVGLVKVRSRLSLSASDSFFLANEHVLSVQAAQLATDPAHRASAAIPR